MQMPHCVHVATDVCGHVPGTVQEQQGAKCGWHGVNRGEQWERESGRRWGVCVGCTGLCLALSLWWKLLEGSEERETPYDLGFHPITLLIMWRRDCRVLRVEVGRLV